MGAEADQLPEVQHRQYAERVGGHGAVSLIRCRLKELRAKLKKESDPENAWHLKRRIAELTPILTQMNELAELTERYYEKGYYRSEKYSSNGFYKIVNHRKKFG